MLSLSNIAWAAEAEAENLLRMPALGVGGVELAPRRVFGDLQSAGEADVRALAAGFAAAGLRITSFQALLFGVEGVHLFGDRGERRKLVEALIAAGRVAGWCGGVPMVFGAPKNRLKGMLSHAQAVESAVPVFREIGDACARVGSCLVMEANPEAYGADFCTNLEQAAELVARVDSPGFGLHVDAGGMAIGGEEFETVLRQSSAMLRHVHASQPGLGGWDAPDPVHSRVAKVLREIGYTGAIAIEMREQPDGWSAVERAVAQVRSIYFGAGIMPGDRSSS